MAGLAAKTYPAAAKRQARARMGANPAGTAESAVSRRRACVGRSKGVNADCRHRIAAMPASRSQFVGSFESKAAASVGAKAWTAAPIVSCGPPAEGEPPRPPVLLPNTKRSIKPKAS